ncbi:MAG: bifunctional phosphoribosyl-AMP cyclohydrolase/phosphoribosyl-ATP diphosphatase HisIE [Oscillospiraceae bacterium]|jgi:phosphoribosyl-ATP pyrophosphohydrolase/phosphoribosyl-AMP cyclohydrolase|nr:bifunctional phosphoribosyl-AMP cyclohydrolase/phosphoribosyl-ATP diphosphatase HisIE [Oscillospiraceae bacterium]
MITKSNIDGLTFGGDGLIPAIVQDAGTREVLTLAYMNRESLEITLREGRTCFWSRSRGELWRKGETSGNIQYVREVLPDCDGDALLVLVDKVGPACHTGAQSCFGEAGGPSANVTDELYALLLDRLHRPKDGSYTTYLFKKGLDKILKKIGEESTEVVIAAKGGDIGETVYELADLQYHCLVLMASMGITPGDVSRELRSRHVVDSKAKQETGAAQLGNRVES